MALRTLGVASASPVGTITIFSHPDLVSPNSLTTGPDGNLWFISSDKATWIPDLIGRITTDGTITIFSHPDLYYLESLTTGSDGNLWFTDRGNSIGRITTDGTITLFSHPDLYCPEFITTGPDGNLWFTNGKSIGLVLRL